MGPSGGSCAWNARSSGLQDKYDAFAGSPDSSALATRRRRSIWRRSNRSVRSLSPRQQPAGSADCSACRCCGEPSLQPSLHEVPLIGRPSFDQRKEALELPVAGRFVMHGTPRDHGKRRPFDELSIACCPSPDLLSSEGCHLEQNRHLIADVPGVEVLHPPLGLGFRELHRISHEAGKDAGLMVARLPQLLRQVVITADLPGESAQGRDGDPQCALRLMPKRAFPATSFGLAIFLSRVMTRVEFKAIPYTRVTSPRVSWKCTNPRGGEQSG